MMKVRGLNLWPITVDDIVLTAAGVRNYAGLVRRHNDGREDIFVHVEFDPSVAVNDRPAIIKKLSDQIRSMTGLRMDVSEASMPLPEFKDTESKARRWRDERNAK
jgi:phenylacetate-coenzyme A ligase PaaK-like adenylate-forming protein